MAETLPNPVQLDIYRTALPMRRFDHAAAQREVAEAIVTRLEYSDGVVGWGETLPREYVTGETLETVPRDIEETLWPMCLEEGLLLPADHPKPLPVTANRRTIAAAACALDIAAMRRLMHDLLDISPHTLQKVARRARLRNYIDARVSGVLGSAEPKKTAWRLRLMRWYGLRDFKLKLGLGGDIDEANLRVVHRQLRRGLRTGQASLRVDVNGGWAEEDVPARMEALRDYGVCAVEQPVFCGASKLVKLAERCPLPILADETLVTERNAKTLLEAGEKVWWNIRLSKNGGLLASLRLMHLATANHVPFVLGCMVGESSILSAAQRRALQLGPVPRFVEGNYGRFLLHEDFLTGWKSLRFGYGGVLRPLRGEGLGVGISREGVERFGGLIKTLRAPGR